MKEVEFHLEKHIEWWIYHVKYTRDRKKDMILGCRNTEKLFNLQHAMIV